MNNDELKKKILSIVRGATIEADELPFIEATEHITDALIEAGIGDVSEFKNHRLIAEYSLIPEDDNAYVLPNTPIRVKQLYSGEEVEQIVKEREEYKHRAEVAERALLRACKVNTIFAEPDVPNILAERVLYEFYIRQAEEEIAEEDK